MPIIRITPPIFMQFLAKIVPNNRFSPKLRGVGFPPLVWELLNPPLPPYIRVLVPFKITLRRVASKIVSNIKSYHIAKVVCSAWKLKCTEFLCCNVKKQTSHLPSFMVVEFHDPLHYTHDCVNFLTVAIDVEIAIKFSGTFPLHRYLQCCS